MTNKTKNWVSKLKATKEKRQQQDCKVYSLKFDMSRLSRDKKEYLKKLFIEAKWLYNSILASNNIFKYNTKSDDAIGLDKDKNVITRNLNLLSSQMKQSVKQKIGYAIKALSAKNKKGKKNEVGKLKFKSRVNAIVLNQYGITYNFTENKKFIKLQGAKSKFKIIGYSQIHKEAEFANATLINKAGNYYLNVTCYLPKQVKVFKEKEVGVDFGLKNTLTLSNSKKFSVIIAESKRLKFYQKQRKNKVKFSKNWNKLNLKINKEYEKINNQKKDKRNKIVSYITNTFETVCIQDENIKGWHKGSFGKSVQHSILGGLMSDLKKKSHTLKIVDRFQPTTKLCPRCGKLNNITLADRIYYCSCGYSQDRDIHAANNILELGTERIKIKPVENKTSTLVNLYLSKQVCSMNQEAYAFRHG